MSYPEDLSPGVIEKAVRLGLHEEDFDEQFVRGSGKGGQKINTTANCVQLRHGPSGLEVKIQTHRSREANRKTAYRLLILKIESEKLGKASALKKAQFKKRKQKQRRSRRGQAKVLAEKRHRGEIKALRKEPEL